jgi:hypothetical protein
MAIADDADIAHRQALQNGIDELLAPERAGILDLELLGDAEQLGRRLAARHGHEAAIMRQPHMPGQQQVDHDGATQPG